MGAALLCTQGAIGGDVSAARVPETDTDADEMIDLHVMASMAPPGFLGDVVWGLPEEEEEAEGDVGGAQDLRRDTRDDVPNRRAMLLTRATCPLAYCPACPSEDVLSAVTLLVTLTI